MSRPLRRHLRTPLFGLLRPLAVGIFGRLSWHRAQAAGRALGNAYWRHGKRDRKRALEHLAIAFPELDAAQRADLGRASFRHLGMSLCECLHLLHRSPIEACSHVKVEGFHHVERHAGRPAVVMTGHCGNWELISTANQSHDLGLAAIARQIDDPQLDSAIVGLRRHLGSATIHRGSPGASKALLRVVRTGGALALLIDQDIDTDGVWVPFFGRPAHTPRAAADLALRLGAAVIPTFSARLEDGSHRVVFHPPLTLPSDPQQATASMTAAIEAQIRRYPEQWVWMHRRWRRQPPP